MFPVVFSFFEAVRERQPSSPAPSRREGAESMKKFTIAAVAAFALAAGCRLRRPILSPRPSRLPRRSRRRGISRSVRRSPATISSAASRSRTIKPSVAAYFEPRYNINKDLQFYAGIGGASIASRTAPRLRSTSTPAIRPTFGKFAFDFGVWYYWYPGGQCFSHRQLQHCRLLAKRRRRSAGAAERQRHQDGPELLSKSTAR